MSFPIASSPWAGSNPNPAYAGIFIPEIWSGKLLEKFYAATVLAAIANTDYYVYLIKRVDTDVVDAIFSASATAPTLPTNYTLFRRIGSISTVTR